MEKTLIWCSTHSKSSVWMFNCFSTVCVKKLPLLNCICIFVKNQLTLIYMHRILISILFHYLCVCVCVCVCLFRTAAMAYGSSQARGQIELQLPAYTTATAMLDP